MTAPCVHVVDDDGSIRTSLARLLAGAGYPHALYASAEALLAMAGPDLRGCLILDLRLPRMSGLELQAALRDHGCHLPIVFLTGHGDVTASVRAMKLGAVDFLEKPVSADALLAAVAAALSREEADYASRTEREALNALVATLTERERAVWLGVVRGQLNKQIGYDLGIVERTVKVHRRNAMRKLRAESLADLVRIADRLALMPAGDATGP